ncbi:restriction endonuclease subunit S [Treponema succinifaciens]|uniref:restriction endonuclease subunit S n=1 Tax=Treponema succinifaciens TaxID=167 RepID=UPI0023EF7440|nr:restriction endonuclease subunit S [Treponema succinifaciens]
MSEWKTVRLGDVCEILNGYAFKSDKYVDSGIRVIRITNVQKGFIEDNSPAFYPITEKETLKDYELHENDLLISLTGNVGRVALLSKEMLPAALNQRVGCIRIRDKNLLISYLFTFLNSDKFESDCIYSARGIAQKNMSTEWLKNYLIPLPPIEVQIKIANNLNTCSKIIKKHNKQLNNFDLLIKSRFIEMFGDIRNQEKYKGIPLSNLCKTMTGGTPPTSKPEYYEGTIPWITTVSLGPNHIDGKNAKGYITEEAIKNSATKLIPVGNILFGTRVGVGKSSINDVDICTNQDIIALIGIDESRYSKLFIKHVLDQYQPYFDSIKKGATILGITTDDVKKSLIPDVSLSLQKEFENFVQQIDKSKFEIANSLKRLYNKGMLS